MLSSQTPLVVLGIFAKILISASVASADDDSFIEFSPARIGTHADALQFLIRVPDKRRNQTFVSTIRCQTYVEIDGTLSNYLCVRGSRDDIDLLRQVKDGIRKSIFEPATVDGNLIKIYMNFMIGFKCDAGECAVVAAPHHGYHIQEFGFNYIAPQSIVDEKFWDKRSWERDNALSMRMIADGYLFFLSALIDEQGGASDVSIDYVDPAWRAEAKRAAVYYERMNFIPGMLDGAVISMRATDFLGIGLRRSGGP